MHRFILLLLALFPLYTSAQASFTATATPYTQNFNSLPNTVDGGTPTGGWTDNVTLTGWYSSVAPIVESSTASMNNAGANYIVASGADRSIGSRPSNSTGVTYYGVRIANNTGTTITSINVEYYGEQWSIAENGTNVNTIGFSYRTGSGLTSLTAGAWTNVPALAFTQLYTSSQSAGMGGSACGGTSNQCLSLNGNNAANRTRIAGCLAVTIAPGSEIMLRWSDANDASNDHHLQIDDLTVYPYNVSCATVLPVRWLSFTAQRNGAAALLEWSTASEENNDYFSIERIDETGLYVSIGTVQGNGTTSQQSSYRFFDESPLSGINYYRIRQVDYNGQSDCSVIQVVEFGDEEIFSASAYYDGALHFYQDGNEGETTITVTDQNGRVINRAISVAAKGELQAPDVSGIYFIRFENAAGVVIVKQLIIL